MIPPNDPDTALIAGLTPTLPATAAAPAAADVVAAFSVFSLADGIKNFPFVGRCD